jgi:hypothetical protein
MNDQREMNRDTEEELEVFFKLLCWYLSAGTGAHDHGISSS